MSTTTIKTFPVRAFRRVKDAFADMNYAQRRLFELRTDLPHDYRKRAEIERLEALIRLRPRI
jgi:hypothetical protein